MEALVHLNPANKVVCACALSGLFFLIHLSKEGWPQSTYAGFLTDSDVAVYA